MRLPTQDVPPSIAPQHRLEHCAHTSYRMERNTESPTEEANPTSRCTTFEVVVFVDNVWTLKGLPFLGPRTRLRPGPSENLPFGPLTRSVDASDFGSLDCATPCNNTLGWVLGVLVVFLKGSGWWSCRISGVSLGARGRSSGGPGGVRRKGPGVLRGSAGKGPVIGGPSPSWEEEVLGPPSDESLYPMLE